MTERGCSTSQQENQDLWGVLLLGTSGSANNAVKKFEGKRPEDVSGHGQLARKTLTEKYNGHTKEARRACHEKLVNTKMEPGQDTDDLFYVVDEYCDLFEEMGQTVYDERYEDIILQALPPEYERVRTASYERRNFGLDDIRHMVHTMYVDNPFALRQRQAGRGPRNCHAGGGAHWQWCAVQLMQ